MKLLESEGYVVPVVVASYATRDLHDQAAACQGYGVNESDGGLKEDVEVIQAPVSGLSKIETNL